MAGKPLQINKYDKLLRMQFLNTQMPPLRYTRLGIPELTDHIQLLRELGSKQRAVEECWSRLLKSFMWN